MWKQTREGQVVRTNERGPRFVKKERKKGPRCVNEREGQVVRTKDRGPGCVNKRGRERERERARLCKQKKEGQVV